MTHRFRTMTERGTTTQRGYDKQHRADRTANLPRFLGTRCPGLPADATHQRLNCPNLIGTDAHWDHDDWAPASQGHRGKRFLCPRCNKVKAARKGNRRQARRHPQLGRKVRRVTPLDL